jgi:putative flippase GtrA
MRDNFCSGSTLRPNEFVAKGASSPQAIEAVDVAHRDEMENVSPGADFAIAPAAKSCADNAMQEIAWRWIARIPRNSFSVTEMRGSSCARAAEKTSVKIEKPLHGVRLERWLKFNFVGGIGIGVQFGALFLLKSIFHFDYLLATALAVETAVAHNFLWHERFTWADRVQLGRVQPANTPGARARNVFRELFAALKRRATQKQSAIQSKRLAQNKRAIESHSAITSHSARPGRAEGLARFLRFNLTTGAVSIIGNLALMKVMVGFGHVNYLFANAVAIALCSVTNFLVSDAWVFGE